MYSCGRVLKRLLQNGQRKGFGTRLLSSEALPFEKILVANRGEIAVRIMKTAKAMGIGSVAVYSDADKHSVHVQMADEKVYLGPSESLQSYLKIDAVLDAMRKTSAPAVAPGYGFLSENEHFVSEVEKNGFEFIGPPAKAVKMMGDKVASKKIAHEAGVNTIPGWIGIVDGQDHAAQIAKEIGYPVMIKASGGGGGKGMRIAHSEAELKDVFQMACDEAANSFNDSRMLIEKYIERPRHVEIQILGDKFGNIVYLPERECSIQRRNQKVIEEAPSPIMTEKLRKEMGEAALRLAKSVGYYSVGTCEFLVDQQSKFYFLEMNTRLQVEHAITEAITGLDLVEEMIKVAAGAKVEYDQATIAKPKGWAFESRVYAEDPSRGYLPSTGYLKYYWEPKGDVRVDSGVTEGSNISMYYDAMISKVITSGRDRNEALIKARDALDNYVIRGVTNNLGLLRNVLGKKEFEEGITDTWFLGRHYPTEDSLDPLCFDLPKEKEMQLAAIALAQHVWKSLYMQSTHSNEDLTWIKILSLKSNSDFTVQAKVYKSPKGMQCYHGSSLLHPLTIEASGAIATVEVESDDDVGACLSQRPLGHVRINGDLVTFQNMYSGPRHSHLQVNGSQRKYTIDSCDTAAFRHIMPTVSLSDVSMYVKSPMPGIVISVLVSPGDLVKRGDHLAIVEAMKMQNVIKAPHDGKIGDVSVKDRDTIAADQVILVYQ